MAVKIGKVPQQNQSTRGPIDVNNPESARGRRIQRIYDTLCPDWQGRQKGRDREFTGLFDALRDDGLFSKDNEKERKRVYFPAANRQLETRVFAGHCDDVLFIGGDIAGKRVHEGKKMLKQGNADFVVADGFRVPFENGSLDAIVDIAGAAWYALEPHSPGNSSRDNLKSLLYEWHRALGTKGVVVLDDYPERGHAYSSTMRRMAEAAPDIFENVKKGGFYFSVGDYNVAFKTRTLKLESGRAYVFEKT